MALTILAFGVASFRLGAKSLWLDEGVSADHAQLGLSGLWQVVSRTDPNMGLYYVMLHLWVGVFGDADTSLRAMSVLLGGLAVPAVALLGRRLFDRASGLAAGLLLALAPFFVHYEQTARSYALVVTLTALSSYFFVVELERPSRRTRAAYVLVSALAIYAHYLAAFVVVVQAATLLAVRRRAAFSRGWTASGACLAVLCAPEIVFAARAGPGQIEWIPRPSITGLLHLPGDLAGGTVIACALILLATYGVAYLAADGRWQAGFVAAWCVGPVLLDLAISWLGRPLLLPYYLITILPAWLLLAGAGAVRLPGSAVSWGSLGLVVALLVVGLVDWYRQPGAENYRGAARFLLAHARGGDAVFYDPSYAAYPFTHYEALAHAIGPPVLGTLPTQPSAGRPSRLWLVFRDSDVPLAQQTQVKRSLAAGYAQVGPQTAFTNLTLILYRAR